MAFFEDVNRALNADTPLAAMLKTNQHRAMPDVPEADARAYGNQPSQPNQPLPVPKAAPEGNPYAARNAELLAANTAGGSPDETYTPSTRGIKTGNSGQQAWQDKSAAYRADPYAGGIERPMGAAQSNNANPWAAMAQRLAQDSQQRHLPMSWQDQYGNRDPEKDRIAESNAMMSRWNGDYRPQQALDARYAANEAQLGKLKEAGIEGRTRRDVAHITGGYGLDAEGMRGRNATDVATLRNEGELNREGVRGRYGLQERELANKGALEVEGIKQKDPSKAASTKESDARAGLYAEQTGALKRQAEFDKTADASIQKWASMLMKDGGLSADEAMARALKLYLGSKRTTEAKANGGLVGYAEGDLVDSSPQFQTRTSAELATDAANKQASDQQAFSQGIMAIGRGASPQTAQAGTAVATPNSSAPALSSSAPRSMAPYTPGGIGDPKASFSTGPVTGPRRAAPADPGRTPLRPFDNSAMQFADGGMIDVGGRLLDGAGTGKSDSLPAMIDGEHPAALSKGEFVMPIETVQHFGLDKLRKMVAASRKGLDTGRQQA